MFDAMSADKGSTVKKDFSNARMKDSNCLYDPKIHVRGRKGDKEGI